MSYNSLAWLVEQCGHGEIGLECNTEEANGGSSQRILALCSANRVLSSPCEMHAATDGLPR